MDRSRRQSMIDDRLSDLILGHQRSLEKIEIRERQLVTSSVYRTTSQSIAASTWTAVSFSAEILDPFGMWAIGDATKVICTVPGYYDALGAIRFAGNDTGTTRQVRIVKNGSSVYGFTSLPIIAGINQTIRLQVRAVTPIPMAVGDYLELQVFHDVGIAINLTFGAGEGQYFWIWKMIS